MNDGHNGGRGHESNEPNYIDCYYFIMFSTCLVRPGKRIRIKWSVRYLITGQYLQCIFNNVTRQTMSSSEIRSMSVGHVYFGFVKNRSFDKEKKRKLFKCFFLFFFRITLVEGLRVIRIKCVLADYKYIVFSKALAHLILFIHLKPRQLTIQVSRLRVSLRVLHYAA